MGVSGVDGDKKRRGELDAVLALCSYGITITEAFSLLEYGGDLEYFMSEYSKQKNKEKIIQRVESVDAEIMARNFSGNKAAYTKWRLDQQDLLKEYSKPTIKKTFFDKMKEVVKSNRKTFFDKMKGR